MHAVVPKYWCPHLEPDLEMIQPIPDGKLNHLASCQECGHVGENWVCLTCYEVGKDTSHIIVHISELDITFGDISTLSCGDAGSHMV